MDFLDLSRFAGVSGERFLIQLCDKLDFMLARGCWLLSSFASEGDTVEDKGVEEDLVVVDMLLEKAVVPTRDRGLVKDVPRIANSAAVVNLRLRPVQVLILLLLKTLMLR